MFESNFVFTFSNHVARKETCSCHVIYDCFVQIKIFLSHRRCSFVLANPEIFLMGIGLLESYTIEHGLSISHV